MMKYSLYIKQFLFNTGVLSLSRRVIETQTASILRYHSISASEGNFYVPASISLNPSEFESQIRFLSENYQVISLDVIADCIATQRPFPEKAVALTFDDGYRDNYLAYQILKSCKVTGTFYVVAGCIDGQEPLWLFEVYYLLHKTSQSELLITVKDTPYHFSLSSQEDRFRASRKITELIKSHNREMRERIRKQLRSQLYDVSDVDEKSLHVMLTWKQVQEMSQNGMTIGGHTMTHLNLPNADYADAVAEIQGCKQMLEEKLGVPVRHFSYPNSGNYAYYNDTIMNIVRKSGYITSTTSLNGAVDLNSNPLELKRIRITPHLSEIIYQMNCEPIINRLKGKAGFGKTIT